MDRPRRARDGRPAQRRHARLGSLELRPGLVGPHGALAFLVRLAHERWDVGLLRSVAMLAGCGVALLALARSPCAAGGLGARRGAAVAVVAAARVPAVALQLGLRQSTQPWFFVNDSTYQIELAGQRSATASSPYGHDYGGSGLERFYSLDGSEPPGHGRAPGRAPPFRLLPGARTARGGWGALPAPWDDYRVLVALASLGLLGVALAFPGRCGRGSTFGIAAAANPVVVRGAWFGTADAPTLLLLLAAFALALRRRPGWAGVALGAAILTKQFALAAAPFLLATLLVRAGTTGRATRRSPPAAV